MIYSDDIGSFPLPDGVERGRLQEIGLSLIKGDCGEKDKREFNRIVVEAMKAKISSKIMRPNYPQLLNMISGFFQPIDLYHDPKTPWVVFREKARIPELDALEPAAKEHVESTGKPVELRVCVTGPLELYLNSVGSQVQGNLLKNIGLSLSYFIKNSIIKSRHLKTTVISLDEPSLGFDPNLVVKDDDLIDAWDKAAEPARNLDVQMHLHSSARFDLVCQSEYVKIIGVESAENPKNLEEIDERELESYDKFLRVGISRTNINSLAADYKEKTGVDVWQDKSGLMDMVREMENTRNIGKRLQKAWKLYGENILYAGPDCGLGSWPSQETAAKLLENTSNAVEEFNKTLLYRNL